MLPQQSALWAGNGARRLVNLRDRHCRVPSSEVQIARIFRGFWQGPVRRGKSGIRFVGSAHEE